MTQKLKLLFTVTSYLSAPNHAVAEKDMYRANFIASTQIAELIVHMTENTSMIPTKILLGKYTARHQINPEVIPLLDTVGDHFNAENQTVRVVTMRNL